MTDEDSTTLPRRQLGKHLREARQAANMTLEEVGALMQWSASKLQRVEKGQAPQVRMVDVEALCRFLDIATEEVAAIRALTLQVSATKSWFHAFDDVIPGNFNTYVGLESSARHLTVFRPDMLSGIFQTREYARALDRVYFADDSDDELERRMKLKVRRQALITRRTRPATVDLVVHETVLRTVVGGPLVMSAQLHHLANMPPNLTVRVLPYSAGFPGGTSTGPFTILDFGLDSRGREVAPSVVYIEAHAGDLYLERQKDVDRYHQAYGVILQSTMDVASSKSLLRSIAREYLA